MGKENGLNVYWVRFLDGSEYEFKIGMELQNMKHRLFEVEFARDIMQQESDSLDYGTYVAIFAEFLSDEMKVPSIPFRSDYLRSRYATLLWKFGTDKVKAGYVSENDDPTRLKGVFIPLTDDELINVE
ncbi:hypothetical protein KY285_028416 [Solanum tuberosum]|nr:hypothetical protein KY289_028542 [Solanum tuberosum]KAH0667210.1 hypothetical protein KY285_028416 [Solanum tuberosum]